MTVHAPDGTYLTTLASGTTATPSAGAGAYQLTVGTQQNLGHAWDVAVDNHSDARGRLHSYDWQFNAGSFGQSRGYFYFTSLVEGTYPLRVHAEPAPGTGWHPPLGGAAATPIASARLDRPRGYDPTRATSAATSSTNAALW